VEKEEPNDASAKVLFLQRNVLPRRFGSKNTQKDLAEKTGVARKTLNDQLNHTKRLSPAVQSALAKTFDFSVDWPEWKTGSAAEFEKKYKTQHPDRQPTAPLRRTDARLSKGPRQAPVHSKIKGLVAVEIDGSQFGPGTSAIEAMISCGMPLVLEAHTTIKSARIELKCSPAMLTKNALDAWLCRPREVTGTHGSVHIAFEAGTRDMAGWRLTAEEASVGTIVLDPDFAALEELAPGDEITLEFGTWLPEHLPEGAIFQDAPLGPEMVVIPAGEFLMGSGEEEARLGEDDEAETDEIMPGQGKRRMRVVRRFALGRYPVTFEEYDTFLDATVGKRPRGDDEADDNGWGRGRRPVISVSWQDAQRYCAWLNRKTALLGDFGYRLPSESEWEYACRAGTNTRRWWGDTWDTTKANGAGRTYHFGRETSPSPAGTYAANPWGLYDMIGNVDEWCADCWADNISELPADGAPFLRTEAADSSLRVLRGGSWFDGPQNLRSATRNRGPPDGRGNGIGFRVARTLLPPSS
jgi:formylglycine-generating enzyme required for sulfatase activity